MDDVSGYSIQVTTEDTKENSSMLLINVKLTSDTKEVLVARRAEFETLKVRLAAFATEKIDIEVVLPAILEKNDFTKEELTEGI